MLILDSTAGYRKMWKGHSCENIVFLDLRKEVHPTVCGDIRHLPLKDQSFDVIFFDPPHHVPAKGYMFNETYGEGLKPLQRVALFFQANNEFNRILRKEGLLFCKTTNMPTNPGFSSKHMDESLKQQLTNFRMFSKSCKPSRKSKRALVCWCNYRKIACVGGKPIAEAK